MAAAMATEPLTGGRLVMSHEYFAGRLKELREAKGWTQEELARKAGVSQRGIANWELGLRAPSWPNVVALAEALGVPTDTFLKPPAKRPPAGRGRPPKGKPGPKGRRKKGG
jgi:transcriptional regulator with XRE-family HTH domain